MKVTLTRDELASLEGSAVRYWVNQIAPSGTKVLSGLAMDVEENKSVLITTAEAQVVSVNDSFDYEVGITDGLLGSGTFTPLTMKHRAINISLLGTLKISHTFKPPLVASYADGARSVTIKCTSNDGAAVGSFEWAGINVEDKVG